MTKKFYNVCRGCGEVIEATSANNVYCNKPECQSMKAERVNWFSKPEPENDMPLYVLAEIMQFEGINYQMYTQNRDFYIQRHINRCGDDKYIAIFPKN